jgi:hypothetical protein
MSHGNLLTIIKLCSYACQAESKLGNEFLGLARHLALPVAGRGVGASEDQQFGLPHGPPHLKD